MSKSKVKKQTWEEKQERITAITDQMNTAVNSYFETPEQMKEYLAFMSNFYGYSPRNSALIHSQFRGAEAVGSFKFWKEKGFAVQKGEKGIQILVPNKSQPKFKDSDGKWKGLKYAKADERKKIEKGELKKRNGQTFFSLGYVFDISQTNATAEDLPEIFPNRWLEGEVTAYKVFMGGLEQIGEELNVTVGSPFEELGMAKGAFYHAVDEESDGNGHIGLNPRNSELQNVKTLIHELAHAKLHAGVEGKKLSDAEKEFQAELTAFSVASYFGVDSSDYSIGYLANWTNGKEMNDKAKLLNEVRETSVEFVEVLEKELLRNKALEVTKENELHPAVEGTFELVHKDYMLLEYGGFGAVDVGVTTPSWLEKTVLKGEGFSSVYEFNKQFSEKYALIDPETIKEPTVVIKWSEDSRLESNAIMPFGEANSVMRNIIEVESEEMGYHKTWYTVLIPNENGDVDVLAMDRLDLGDGHFNSPYDQIIREKKITANQQQLLENSLEDNDKVYWYEMTHRPVSIGCQPSGFIEVDNHKGRHGLVAYDRKLSENELDDYEMKSFRNEDNEKTSLKKEVGLER